MLRILLFVVLTTVPNLALAQNKSESSATASADRDAIIKRLGRKTANPGTEINYKKQNKNLSLRNDG